MKKSKFNLLIIFSILLPIVGVLGYFYQDWYHKDVQKHPCGYVYENYRNMVKNPVLAITDLQDTTKYFFYYKTLKSRFYKKNYDTSITEPPITFKLLTLPIREEIFVMGFDKDSCLADIVSYYNRGKYGGGSYLRCWVLAEFVHTKP